LFAFFLVSLWLKLTTKSSKKITTDFFKENSEDDTSNSDNQEAGEVTSPAPISTHESIEEEPTPKKKKKSKKEKKEKESGIYLKNFKIWRVYKFPAGRV
jgi:hypothetical protein